MGRTHSVLVTGVGRCFVVGYVMIHLHMQRFKFIDVMVIELRLFKKKMKNMNKMWKALFELIRMSYITKQPILYTGYFSHILHLNVIKSEINFKLKMNRTTRFSMGIDHTNPFIHSTSSSTV